MRSFCLNVIHLIIVHFFFSRIPFKIGQPRKQIVSKTVRNPQDFSLPFVLMNSVPQNVIAKIMIVFKPDSKTFLMMPISCRYKADRYDITV